MKTLGILGGTGPESTIDYYKLILEVHHERNPDGGNPPLLINSINFNRLSPFRESQDWPSLGVWFAEEFHRLQAAGADFGLIAANTPHVAFDEIESRCKLPLLSIVEAACGRAKEMGLKRVGLLGTKITMNGEFYRGPFVRESIEIFVPADAEQDYVDQKYFDELFFGVFEDETRDGLMAVVDGLIERHGIEGLILGGTELPLILREAPGRGIPFLDTSRIHCEAAVDWILR